MPRRKNDVVVTIEIAAPPHVVRAFFSDPLKFARWFGQGAELGAADPGAFRIPYPNGDVAVGKMKTLSEHRITFSWGYENATHGLGPDESNVEVMLKATAIGTSVRLTHSGLLDERLRKSHLAGWRHHLATLANAAADAFQEPLTESAVNAYLAAWAATDDSERRLLLDESWDDAGVFKDRMGYADGRDALDAYIANAQRFMPGIILRRTGQLLRSHGNVLFGWTLVVPNGTAVGSGWNVGELNSRGQFRQMVGFAQSDELIPRP
jgi:uncharacterized protein YndB with AHSA1/START domain